MDWTVYFFISLMFIPAFAPLIWALWKKKRTAIVAPSSMARLVVDLLDAKAGWSHDAYRMNHPTGLGIWIANEAYGLSVSINGKDPSPASSGLGIELSQIDAEHIWQAVKRYQNNTKEDAMRASIAEFERNLKAWGISGNNVVRFGSKSA